MDKFKKLFEEVDEDMEEVESEFDEESEELPESEIVVGSIVTVMDASSFTADELELTDEDYDSFVSKVDAGETAVVFDIDDEDENKIDIVFSDGLEIFNFPRLALELTEI